MFKSHQPRISKASATAAAERAMFAPRPFKFPDNADRDSDTSDTAHVQAQLNPMDINFCTIPLHAPGRSSLPVQPKLTIGQPGDQYEQEADRMASQVMRMPDSPDGSQPIFQLMKAGLPVQAKGNDTEATQEIESQLSQSKGGGSPLSDEVRSFMEPRFGSSFENVRVHTDGNAVQMNRSLGAQAFTHGSDIYYGAGKSPANSDLTAHELTHVVQQTGSIQAKRNAEGLIQKKEPDVIDLGETTIYSNEELAMQIEEMGGPSYDASKLSYGEMLSKYNEFSDPGMKAIPASPVAVRQASPEEITEGRTIRYLDDNGGVPRVKTKNVQGTKEELDRLEEEELQRILKFQSDGILTGIGGLGGSIPSPGKNSVSPQNTRELRPPYYTEPPR